MRRGRRHPRQRTLGTAERRARTTPTTGPPGECGAARRGRRGSRVRAGRRHASVAGGHVRDRAGHARRGNDRADRHDRTAGTGPERPPVARPRPTVRGGPRTRGAGYRRCPDPRVPRRADPRADHGIADPSTLWRCASSHRHCAAGAPEHFEQRLARHRRAGGRRNRRHRSGVPRVAPSAAARTRSAHARGAGPRLGPGAPRPRQRRRSGGHRPSRRARGG